MASPLHLHANRCTTSSGTNAAAHLSARPRAPSRCLSITGAGRGGGAEQCDGKEEHAIERNVCSSAGTVQTDTATDGGGEYGGSRGYRRAEPRQIKPFGKKSCSLGTFPPLSCPFSGLHGGPGRGGGDSSEEEKNGRRERRGERDERRRR